MAKKSGKEKSAPGNRRWQAHSDDAIRLAALRWFAIEIERVTIELYATDRRSYARMEKLLRGTLEQMEPIREDFSVEDEGDCPIGYVRCKDGVCAPMCDGIIDPDS